MKKVIKSLASAAFCAILSLSFSACSDDDPATPNPGPDPEVPAPTTQWASEGYYKADIYENGTGNLWVALVSSDLVYDADAETYKGPGDIIVIDFNTALAENPDFALLTPGDYVAADTYAQGTINLDGESYITSYDADGEGTTLDVTDGYITVKLISDTYVLEGSLTTSAGDTPIYYVGKITFFNRSEEGEMSNLTSDVELTSLTQGLALYAGEVFTESSDYYMLILAGNEYDLISNYGKSPAVNFGINVAVGSNTGIPSGTYDIVNINEADDLPAGTAVNGFYEATYGGFYGAWYFDSFGGTEAACQTGTITVDNKGDGQYTISFSMKDGYGHTVKGSYTGAISLEDVS